MYLLDTNTCVDAIKRWPDVLDRLRSLSPDDIAVSTVTLAELWFGARKSSRPVATRASVDAFLRPFACLGFDREAADAYARIRLELERSGRPIGERDLLIAAIAASRGLVLVTHDTGELGRIADLEVEDWVGS